MRFKKLHPWDLNPSQAVKIQNQLKRKIKIKKCSVTPKLIAGADVAFKKGKALGAVVVVSYPEFSRQSFSCSSFNTRRDSAPAENIRRDPAYERRKVIECVRKSAKISYPYIPGLLTFREGPVLEKCFKVLRNEPDVIIFDGQGTAHPRNMGLATHLGILLNKPSIGCAKTLLFGNYVEPPALRGAFSYLLDKQGKKIGAVLRTRDFTKPVYVSPGHKINLASSIKIILLCTEKYRLPEPLRLAHHLTKHPKNLLPKLKFLL